MKKYTFELENGGVTCSQEAGSWLGKMVNNTERDVLKKVKEEIRHRVLQNKGMCLAEDNHDHTKIVCPREYSNSDLLAALEEIRAKVNHDI